MKYDKLKEHFRTEDGMNKLLKECQEIFDGIDNLNEKLVEGMLNDPESCALALQESTGYYSYLSPITKVSEAIKKNEEGRYYVKRKSEYENEKVVVTIKAKKEGKEDIIKVSKFTDAACKRESEVHSAIYRNVRNILQGYLNSADAIKGSCQSILKALEKEKS